MTPFTFFPELDRLKIFNAPVDDHLSALADEEQELVSRAVAKRRNEFSTGRLCAHQAVVAITGTPARVIVSDDERRPIWPAGVCGSITHTDHLAMAVAVDSGRYFGVGIDAEVISRVDEELWPRLLRPEESRAVQGKDDAATLFSAKEAVYKAINPIVRDFIGFQEVSISLNKREGSFRATYHGQEAANAQLEQGRGWFLLQDDLAICLFTIGK